MKTNNCAPSIDNILLASTSFKIHRYSIASYALYTSDSCHSASSQRSLRSNSYRPCLQIPIAILAARIYAGGGAPEGTSKVDSIPIDILHIAVQTTPITSIPI